MLQTRSAVVALITDQHSLYHQWLENVPEGIRFITAAALGNILFYSIDHTLYQRFLVPFSSNLPRVVQRNKESVSFFVSYLLQIVFQHSLNALFVYGYDTIASREKYLKTLIMTYSSYSTSLFGTTIVNAFMLRQGISKSVAMWGTIFGFGFMNYFLLQYLMKQSTDSATSRNTCKKKADKGTRKRSHLNKFVRGGQQHEYLIADIVKGLLFSP